MSHSYVSAEDKATRILKNLGITEPPIPIDKIAIELGAKLAYEAYDGEVSGMLVRGDGGPSVIGVNSWHASTRQRFTIAHEIAHLVMHRGTEMFVDRFVRVNLRDGKSNLEEAEANAFAAELLMPREMVTDRVTQALGKNEQLGPQDLARQLAKTFDVSSQAMSYRLENLGIVGPIGLST